MNIDRLDLQSPDLVSENFEKLAALFPNCVTESTEGKVIDFDLLKQELNHTLIEGNRERYRLEWPGKREAIVTANLPTTKTLRPVREGSVEYDNTENMYIEGDNLEVLKILQESYFGKIKMIYIDPPYNTGNDFVYKDNFTIGKEEELYESGQKDDYNRRLFANSDSSGRYHSDWLSMMYPRLKLSRNLLTEDGVIFISVDDNEVHNLRKICDEVFGEKNFVGNIIWQTATDNNPSQIATEHEYIICYAKNLSSQPKWVIPSSKAEKIINKYNELKSLYGNNTPTLQKELKKWIEKNEKDLKGTTHYSYIDEKGIYYPGNSSNTKPGGYLFDIIHPITRKICKKPDYGYRWTEKTFLDADKNGDVEWGNDETIIPKIKKRIDSVKEMLKSYYYEDNRYWTKYLNSMFGRRVFENPKSVKMLIHIIKFIIDKNDTILDFFSGSATTAHAVMQLNAEDGGNRKYIMVQLPEQTDEKSEAYKAGYKNICEIGKERIRRAANKIREEKKNKIYKQAEKDGVMVDLAPDTQDYGFRVYRLDSSNMQDVYYRPQDYTQETLELFSDNIKPDRTADDLLAQVILDWGLPLSYKIEQASINGKQVFKVAQDSLFACFDEGIDEAFAKEIAKEKPMRIVFRDNGFANDTAKINVQQLLKQLSPKTEMKVI